MGSVREIHGGWGSVTVLVDGEHIYRFARRPDVAAAHRREFALLPLLAAALSVRVPEPDFFGEWGDATCLGYPLIEGRPFTAADDWRSVAAVLRELHAFPVAGLPLDTDWRGYYQRLDVDRVLPALDAALAQVLTREYARFLDGDWDFTPTLVHRDLQPEHILVDDAGRVAGLIDFEDAAVGDPAIDFAGLVPVLGWDRVEDLLAAYGQPVDRDRLRCYWWLVPVHDLLHGLAIGDDAIVDEARADLRSRLSGVGPARRG
jgi:aminoglycoside phosphotransferase (APT) family kinase protein